MSRLVFLIVVDTCCMALLVPVKVSYPVHKLRQRLMFISLASTIYALVLLSMPANDLFTYILS